MARAISPQEKSINTIHTESLAAQLLEKRRSQASSRLKKVLRRKTVRKRLVRMSLVTLNVLLLAGVIGFVSLSSRSDHSQSAVVAALSTNSGDTVVASPVDRVTTYDVAANVAEAVHLDEVNAVNNQAQSARVAVAMSAQDIAIAPKPQVVNTPLKSWRDIQAYVTVAGDTVASVAQKFHVSSDSIRWSNSIAGDALNPGTTLVIPPMDGIVVTVAAGDTPQSLATKYHANVEQIIQANDAEAAGLVVGRQAIIPSGQIVARTISRVVTSGVGYFSPRYGSNGYDWGWCTWYAAARAGAPGNWGNANTWAYYARLSGWNVSSTPTAGAIFQTPAGWAGHVGIVEEVYGNGTMKISDMNGIAGFGRVGYAVVPVTQYPNYITH